MEVDGKLTTGMTLNFDHEMFNSNYCYFCNIVMSVSVKYFYLLSI